MAFPRIFISSTCYDLQEIRFQLRHFIEDFGFEPVMSDFGDIFYDFDEHIQDACKDEIKKSNMFILIIGNNYGSIYHKHDSESLLPDSVTLQEFREALEIGIPKFIFINKFVQHDFENYRRSLSKKISKHFSETKIEDKKIEIEKNRVRDKFHLTYPFPQDAYHYIFNFLEIIYQLEINNAIYPFESFNDISENLKKQWAGFFYDSLTKERNISIEKFEKLNEKIDRIEKQLRLIAEGTQQSKEENKITIDIAKLSSEINIENLENIQNIIDRSLDDIIYYAEDRPRLTISKKFDKEITQNFLNNLSKLVDEYKWSRLIPLENVVIGIPFSYIKKFSEIFYNSIFELNNIANSFNKEDKEALLNTIITKFNQVYEEPKDKEEDDDLPF